MSNNDYGPTFAFPEITADPPGGYHRDRRFKLGEAGEKFIQRHIAQARKLVETFSNPPTKVHNLRYAAFRDEKFAQWKSNGLAADVDTQAKFEKKWNNIRNQIVSQSRSRTDSNAPAGASSTSLPHLVSTTNAITARSIFNEDREETHKATVIRDRRTKDEDSKQHVGRLSALRAAEWCLLTPTQQAKYKAKAEAERQRVCGDVEDCQNELLNTIKEVVSAAVGTNPGQVGHAGFAFQYMFNTKDGQRKCGGFGLGECNRLAEAPIFRNKLMPIFERFANDHVTFTPVEQPNDPYEGVFARNESGHYLLPEIEDDEFFSEYRTKLKQFLTAYWNSMFPILSQVSDIPWADIYRSPTSFFVDSVIPAGSPSMDRIEVMTCSSMVKLADRIRLVQQTDQPNIFRAKADLLRVLRGSPSEADASKIPNKEVTIIDVDAIPSTPSSPRLLLAPDVTITKSPRSSGPINTPHGGNKRKSPEISFSDDATDSTFADGTRSPKRSRPWGYQAVPLLLAQTPRASTYRFNGHSSIRASNRRS